MKQKIIVIDKNGKKTQNEITIRNIDHFNIQKNNKAQIFKDKTKYTRKKKHKAEEY